MLPKSDNEVDDGLLLRNLRLGAASVDLMVRRHDEEVSVELLRTSGKIEVSVTFAR